MQEISETTKLYCDFIILLPSVPDVSDKCFFYLTFSYKGLTWIFVGQFFVMA